VIDSEAKGRVRGLAIGIIAYLRFTIVGTDRGIASWNWPNVCAAA